VSSFDALKTGLGIAAILLLLVAPLIAQIALMVWWLRRRVNGATTSPSWRALQMEVLLLVISSTLVEAGLLRVVVYITNAHRHYLGYVGLFFYAMVIVYGIIALAAGFIFATVIWLNERNNRAEKTGPPPLR